MTPDERGDPRTGGDLPETGGMSPATLLIVGAALLLTGSTGLSAVVRRRSASRG
jgi:CRP/FNR family cyclic AMP-dependent transcriptional regulator